jgi:hypothetical protein
MVVDEGQRRALHQRLVEVLGLPTADVLMEHLPPSGWGDVARRSDVDSLERVLRTELESMRVEMRGEMAELRGGVAEALAKQTRTVIVGMASMVVSVVGSLAIAAMTFGR